MLSRVRDVEKTVYDRYMLLDVVHMSSTLVIFGSLPLPCHPGFLGMVSQGFSFEASIASVRIIGFVQGITRFKTDKHGKI